MKQKKCVRENFRKFPHEKTKMPVTIFHFYSEIKHKKSTKISENLFSTPKVVNFVCFIAKTGREIQILDMLAEIVENLKVNIKSQKKVLNRCQPISKLLNNSANEFLMLDLFNYTTKQPQFLLKTHNLSFA